MMENVWLVVKIALFVKILLNVLNQLVDISFTTIIVSKHVLLELMQLELLALTVTQPVLYVLALMLITAQLVPTDLD